MDEQRFYEKLGKANGWDFSTLKSESEGEAWDFYREAANYSAPGSIVLDIGTGGAENVMKLAESCALVVGIDLSGAMVETARSNGEKANCRNVRFLQMAAESLHFPEGFFDMATSRHCPYDAAEAARVLKAGGIFLSQQVSEGDKENLKQAFGRGQAFGQRDGMLKERYIKELEEAGFSGIESDDYDAVEYYQEPEDLLFLLQHTPIIPNFGEEPQDMETFNKFILQNQTSKGIRTNSKRFLLKAYKKE